jgi:hypothetical protein
LGAIRAIVPEKPDDPVALLDACLVFFPKHFEQCPSLAEAAGSLEGMTRLDFDQEKEAIPAIWPHFGKRPGPTSSVCTSSRRSLPRS